MEQLDYNLLFRWFVGLDIDDAVWDATVFCKNRDRLLAGDVARRFLDEVLAHARLRDLLSDEHFSVDGTLFEAWASMKSFRAQGRGRGQHAADRRAAMPSGTSTARSGRNATHASTTDPDARLMPQGSGQGSQALLRRPRGDGEPQRSGGGRRR